MKVNRFGFSEDWPDLAKVSAGLDDTFDVNRIDCLNWKEYNYKPDVEFRMAYSDNEIFLKYYVREEYVKAEKTGINQDVYKDSCVEFFVSPSADGFYYNMEFNSIGAVLMAYGSSRDNRKRVDPSIAGKIRTLASMGAEPFREKEGQFEWTLTLAIPFEVFFKDRITGLKGSSFRANFYKCGDDLTKPHYLSWNPIEIESPDFHRPEYFGQLKFM